MESDECTVRGALALILLVSRALGAAPLHMTRTRSGWSIGGVSRPFAVYSYCFTCVLHGLLFAALLIDMTSDESDAILTPSTPSRIVVPLENIAIVTTVSLVVHQGKRRMQKIIASLNILYKIQMELNKYVKGTTENKRLFCAFFCLLFACYPTFQYLYSDLQKVLQRGSSMTVVYLNTSFYIQLFILNLLTLQFLFVTMNVKSALEGVNDVFEEHIAIIEKKWSPESIASIRHLTHSFATVCDVMRDIDDCFGDVLMLIVSCFLMMLVVVPFCIIQNLLQGSTNITDLVMQVGTMVALVISLMFACEPSYRTEDELQRMRSSTNCLLRHVSAHPKVDLTLELDLLIKQINFNSITYKPCDMFTLDRSLILGVIGTAITLILIVLKYQAMEQQQLMQNKDTNNFSTKL